MSFTSLIKFISKHQLTGFILGIGALDLTLRSSDAWAWSAEEKSIYAVSFLLSAVWAHVLRNTLTLFLGNRKILLGAVLVLLGGLLTFIYFGSYQFYFHFKSMPNLLSLQFIFRETDEFLSFVWAEPILFFFWAGAIALFFGIWWHFIHAYKQHHKLRFNVWIFLILLLLLPVAHNNVHLIPGSVTPGVNAVFSLSKLLEKLITKKSSPQGLYVRTLPLLPSLQKKSPFNVLLMVHETLRAQSCSFYDYPHPTTPYQSQFLLEDYPNQSFIFQQAFANSTTTQLSFPSILSGIHPGDSAQTLHSAPLFYEYGKLFSKTDTFLLSSQSHKYGNFQNFLKSDYLDVLWNKEVGKKPRFNNHGVDDQHLVPEFATLLKRVQEKNHHFFGVIQFNGTHYPHHVREKDKPAYTLGGGVAEEYDQSIHYVDGIVGQLLEQLKQQGFLENTVILSTSDHGNGLGEHHGEFGHLKRFYNEGVQVPFWIYLPEALAQKYGTQLKVNTQKSVQNIDIVLSILHLLDIVRAPEIQPYISHLRGDNLFGKIPENRKILIQNSNAYYTNLFAGIGIVQNNRKFLFNKKENKIIVEYYDLQADPGEKNNLWNQTTALEKKWLLEEIQQDPLIRQWMPHLHRESQ